MKPDLRVIRPATETPAQLVARLSKEAAGHADAAIEEMLNALKAAERVAAEIADGGPAYPHGVREECRRLAAEIAARADTIMSIMARKS